MDTVTLSPKFQVVIPAKVRSDLKLSAGAKFKVIAQGGRIEFVPLRPMKAMRGFLKLTETGVGRDEADRL